jgi:hypothetical protein
VHADEEVAVEGTEDVLVLRRVFWRYEARFDAADFIKVFEFFCKATDEVGL